MRWISKEDAEAAQELLGRELTEQERTQFHQAVKWHDIRGFIPDQCPTHIKILVDIREERIRKLSEQEQREVGARLRAAAKAGRL